MGAYPTQPVRAEPVEAQNPRPCVGWDSLSVRSRNTSALSVSLCPLCQMRRPNKHPSMPCRRTHGVFFDTEDTEAQRTRRRRLNVSRAQIGLLINFNFPRLIDGVKRFRI